MDWKANKLLAIQKKRREEKAEVARVWVKSGDHKATVDLLHAKRDAERISPEDTGF